MACSLRADTQGGNAPEVSSSAGPRSPLAALHERQVVVVPAGMDLGAM